MSEIWSPPGAAKSESPTGLVRWGVCSHGRQVGAVLQQQFEIIVYSVDGLSTIHHKELEWRDVPMEEIT